MAKIQGRDLVVGTVAGNTFTQLGQCKSCSLSIDTAMKEVGGISHGSCRSFKPGKSSWQVECAGFYLSGEMSLADAQMNRTLFNLSFRETGEKDFLGSAYIKSYKVSGGTNEIATYTVVFQGTGHPVISDL